MTRILVALVAVLALAISGPATAGAATADAAAKKSKPCSTKKGKAKKRCIKAKKQACKKQGKKFNRKKVKCVKRRPAAPKPAPAGAPSTAPIDYTKIAGLSQPDHKEMETLVYEELPAEDGTGLYVEVHKPVGNGPFPVIFEASGYHGTLYERNGTRILPDPKDEEGNPLGLKGYFVPRGYAVVMLDLRGTGKSAGCLDHLGALDLSDIRTVIEWAGTQPWSNGNVGMTGHSYVGGTTNLGGASGAPHLKTIVPSASLASMYDHQFQAGVPYMLQYAGPYIGYPMLAMAADLPPGIPDAVAEAVLGGPTGDNFGNDLQDTGCGYGNTAANGGSGQVTGQYSPWHAERDHREAVKNANIPIFLQHGTVDQAARIAGAQWFFERGLKPGDKLWVGQWDHGIGSAPTRRGMQWTYALHAWFDKHLGGRDVDTGPPLEVFLNNEPSNVGSFDAQEEILAGDRMPATKPFTLFAREDEGLATLPGEPGSVSFAGDAQGFLDNESTEGASFQTEPFTEDKLFFGLPQMQLAASQTVEQVHLIATLFAVEDGHRRRLTQCSLNPLLRDGVETVNPVIPATTNVMTPPCFAMAYEVKKGQSLRLRVTTSDSDKVPLFTNDPNVSVAFGGQDGTQITLPEVTDGKVYVDSIDLGDISGDAGSSG